MWAVTVVAVVVVVVGVSMVVCDGAALTSLVSLCPCFFGWMLLILLLLLLLLLDRYTN